MKTYNFLILFWLMVFIAVWLAFSSCEERIKSVDIKACKPDTVFIPVYEGYIHPSGDYKWTKKGWQALRPFFKLSADSTRLIQIK